MRRLAPRAGTPQVVVKRDPKIEAKEILFTSKRDLLKLVHLRFAHKCQKRPSTTAKRPNIEANET